MLKLGRMHSGGAKVASISFTFPHSTFQIIYLPEQLICMYLSFNQYNPLYMFYSLINVPYSSQTDQDTLIIAFYCISKLQFSFICPSRAGHSISFPHGACADMQLWRPLLSWPEDCRRGAVILRWQVPASHTALARPPHTGLLQ